MTVSTAAPVVFQLWPATSRMHAAARTAVLVIVGTLLLWASAKVQVPFWPVPATLQTLAVVLIGVAYGSRLGAATVLAYLVEGAAGLPVFAGTPEKGLGLLYMAGPTGGYLIGFVAAAFLIGRLVESGFARSLATTACAVLAAHAAVHVFGLAWLSTVFGAAKAIEVAFLPFIAADLVKASLSTAVILLIARRKTR